MKVALLAWPIKRLALSRLAAYASGAEVPPVGAEALLSTADRPVEVAHFLSSDPARVCVYGTPLRATAREVTAEDPSTTGQIAFIEIRVRIFEPGEDVIGVDYALEQMCTAVSTALLATPLYPAGRIWLSAMAQEPQDLAPNPEPSVTAVASLVFAAEAVAYG